MSISSRIEAIEGHIGDIYDTLELGGSDLTNVNKNIVNINSELIDRYKDYLANGTDELWNNWDKATETGVNEATINNTIKGKMAITPKGDTRQFTTSGKNLLPSDLTTLTTRNTGGTWENGVYTRHNVTFTPVYNNGMLEYVIVNGQASDDISFQFGTITPISSSTSYTVSGCPSGGSSTTYRIWLDYIGGDYGSGKSGAAGVTSALNCFINIKSGTSISNLKFYPMVRLTSITDSTYEPYTAGASPNPNYPSPVNNVTGDVEVKVQNKNILPIVNITRTINGITYTVNNDGTITVNGTATAQSVFPINVNSTSLSKTIELKANTNYVMSKTSDQSTTGITFQGFLTKNGSELYPQDTFTTSEATKMGLYLLVANGKIINNVTLKLQLEQGTTATPYIPYQEQNYTISLGDIELCKIGDYQDKIFKAINGNTVYDSLTSEQKAGLTYGNWYKYGAIGKLVLDGSETGQAYSDKDTTNYYCYWLSAPSDIIVSQNVFNLLKCNYFKESTWNDIYSKQHDTPVIALRDNKRLYFRSSENTFSNFQAWLQINKPLVYYVLATPTTTQITDTTLINQLNALEQAYSYNEQTNISQEADLPFILDVTALIELS